MKHEINTDISAAVVGTGFIGPVHVEALRRAGIEVAGVLGSTPEKSREAAAALQIPRAYDSYDELLRDERVQSVHITSPNRFHLQQASLALRAGKHVLCEKPLAMNTGESAELCRIAAGSGVAAGVNYNIRYYPLCREAAQRVRHGDVGEVFHIAGSYVQDWLLYDTDFNWRVLAEEGGQLRAVADIGTHWLDLVQHIAGQQITAVCADLATVHATRKRPTGSVQTFTGSAAAPASTELFPFLRGGQGGSQHAVPIDTDDFGCLLLQFSGGAKGSLWVSQVTAGRKNCLRFEIAGSRRSLAWNSEQPNELWIGRRDGASELLLRDPALLTPEARFLADYPGGHNEGFPDTFKQCFREFYGYISAGNLSAPPPFPTFADGHREIALCEAVLKSHRERKWVGVRG